MAARILVRSRKPGPDVDTYRAAKVDRCDRAQPVQFDGDTVDPTDRLDLEIDPLLPHPGRPRTPPGADPPSQAGPGLSIGTAVSEPTGWKGDEALGILRST